MWHIENPRIGLLNIGEESTKGSPVVTEAYEWLSGQKVVPFAGNAEGRDIMSGEFDVIVTDGFTGNVVLKFGEGAASLFSALLKKSVEKGGLRARLGAFLLKPALKKYLVKRLDYAEYGGAPLMGIKGGLIICHARPKPGQSGMPFIWQKTSVKPVWLMLLQKRWCRLKKKRAA